MCELHNDDCRYDKAPPMTQLVAMAKRLQEAEQAIAELRGGGGRDSSEIATPQVHNVDLLDNTAQPSPRPPPVETSGESSRRLFNSGVVSGNQPSIPTHGIWDEPPSATSQVSSSIQKDPSGPELTVDEHGSVRYYGPTSAVHEPSPGMPDADSPHDIPQRVNLRSSLALHARESTIWEEFAIGNAAVQTGVPRQVIAKLLHIHWTWVSPMFLWIHRSAFIRTSFL